MESSRAGSRGCEGRMVSRSWKAGWVGGVEQKRERSGERNKGLEGKRREAKRRSMLEGWSGGGY